MKPDPDCRICAGTGTYEACLPAPINQLCDAPYYELVDVPCECVGRKEPEPENVTPIELVLT